MREQEASLLPFVKQLEGNMRETRLGNILKCMYQLFARLHLSNTQLMLHITLAVAYGILKTHFGFEIRQWKIPLLQFIDVGYCILYLMYRCRVGLFDNNGFLFHPVCFLCLKKIALTFSNLGIWSR